MTRWENLRTDNVWRYMRYPWFGPKGFRLPANATIPAWAMWAALVTSGVILIWGALGDADLGGPRATLALKSAATLVVAAFNASLTKWVMRYVTGDRNLRHHLDVFLANLTTPRAQTSTIRSRTAIPKAMLHDLARSPK